jgi:hypothetical protein
VKFRVGGTHPRKVLIVETPCQHNVCHDTTVFLSLFFCFSCLLCDVGAALGYYSGVKSVGGEEKAGKRRVTI